MKPYYQSDFATVYCADVLGQVAVRLSELLELEQRA